MQNVFAALLNAPDNQPNFTERITMPCVRTQVILVASTTGDILHTVVSMNTS